MQEWTFEQSHRLLHKCSTQTRTQTFQHFLVSNESNMSNLLNILESGLVNIFNLGHINKKHIKDTLQRHMSYQHFYVSLKSLHSTVTDLVYRHLLMFGLCAFQLVCLL